MDIQIIRIDDRLIHGQVVVGWCPALEIGRLVVVNDAVAANRVKREMMALGVPSGIQADFLGVDGCVKAVAAGGKGERAMLLFDGPTDVLRFARGGGPVTSVNVGGMHFAEGKAEIHNGYFASEKDLESLNALAALGVSLEIRALPGQNPVNLNALLQKGKA
jgi:mannose/fructose/N-acetylgalactosamine-specific phosphotransferase system component IIB